MLSVCSCSPAPSAGADTVARHLTKSGIRTSAIHGGKSQSFRQRALEGFRKGKDRILVATDVAARGIDIDDVSHVINYDMPHEPESYVHRIGRTGRAGASGMALLFCDASERSGLRAIETLTGRKLQVMSDHPYHASTSESAAPARPAQASRRKPSGRRRPAGSRQAGRRRQGIRG
jgi:ATP-dependent RNA helicase RhlE